MLEVIGRSAFEHCSRSSTSLWKPQPELCAADMSVVRLLRDGVLHHSRVRQSQDDPARSGLSQGTHPILQIDRSSGTAGRVVLEGHTHSKIPDLLGRRRVYVSRFARAGSTLVGSGRWESAAP